MVVMSTDGRRRAGQEAFFLMFQTVVIHSHGPARRQGKALIGLNNKILIL